MEVMIWDAVPTTLAVEVEVVGSTTRDEVAMSISTPLDEVTAMAEVLLAKGKTLVASNEELCC